MTAPALPRTRQWSELATSDFATLDLARAIAVLPLGATEQHGPHLPLSVDTDLAQAMVQSAIAQLPPDLPALFLPVQAVGYSPEHAAFAGTLTLKAETVLRLWADIAESVLASGVRKLLLFNTHGGNVGLMDVAARDWRTRLGMLVFSASWFNLPLIESDGKDALQRFAARRPDRDSHDAGAWPRPGAHSTTGTFQFHLEAARARLCRAGQRTQRQIRLGDAGPQRARRRRQCRGCHAPGRTGADRRHGACAGRPDPGNRPAAGRYPAQHLIL